jgi:hypothetical protein
MTPAQMTAKCTNACQYEDPRDQCDVCQAAAALTAAIAAHQQAEQQIAMLTSELAAIANVVGEPYALDGLPLVERVVLLRKQLDADEQRCETWRNEVATLTTERDEAQRLADIYGDGIAEWRP